MTYQSTWLASRPAVTFVVPERQFLPSTLRKCAGIAARLGYGGVRMCKPDRARVEFSTPDAVLVGDAADDHTRGLALEGEGLAWYCRDLQGGVRVVEM